MTLSNNSVRLAEPSTLQGSLRIEPFRPALGALVDGEVVRNGAVDAADADLLRSALYESGALIFRPGSVKLEDFLTVLKAFGEPVLYAGPKTPEVHDLRGANIVDSTDKRAARNYIWHIDQAFRAAPPSLTALFAYKVPSFGGDTLFSNAVTAYERLDPAFRAYLETLTAVHYWDATGHIADRFDDPAEAARQRAINAPIETPIARTHPVTGRKQIYVNESYTTYIKGVSRTVSNALLTILFDAINTQEVQARVTWEQGQVVIWDNRVLQHRGIGDFGGQSRILYRACVK